MQRVCGQHIGGGGVGTSISVGAFTKGLGFWDLLGFIAATGAFVPVLLALCLILLPKQER